MHRNRQEQKNRRKNEFQEVLQLKGFAKWFKKVAISLILLGTLTGQYYTYEEEKEPTVVASEVYFPEDFYFSEETFYFDLVNKEGIFYISTTDAMKMLSKINEITVKYGFDETKFSKQFSPETNQLIVSSKIVKNPIMALAGSNQNLGLDQFSLLNRTYETAYETTAVDLTDFKVRYLLVDGTYYFPIMLMNYAFFDDEFVLYQTDENTFTFSEFFSSSQSLPAPGWVTQPLTQKVRQFTYAYYQMYLRKAYPYYETQANYIHHIFERNATGIYKSDTLAYRKAFYSLVDGLKDGHSLYLLNSDMYVNEEKFYAKNENTLYDFMEQSNYGRISEDYYDMIQRKFQKTTYKKINDQVAYIYIADFMDEDLDQALSVYMENAKESPNLIIDIRFNQGGLYSNVLKVMKYLSDDQLDIYYKQKVHENIFLDKAFNFIKRGEKYYTGNVILLTNRFSFSAANCFAILFKDENMGTIIGEKTEGGGSARVSTVLPDGYFLDISAPKVTFVNKEYEFIDEGIMPDIVVHENYESSQDAVLEEAMKHLK